jgi:hypothetical protein
MLTAIGIDMDSEELCTAFLSAGKLIVETIGSFDARVYSSDTIPREIVQGAIGVYSTGMSRGRYVGVYLMHLESSEILSLDLERIPRVIVEEMTYIARMSSGGVYTIYVGETGTCVMFDASQNRLYPLPSAFYQDMFEGILQTSANDELIAQYARGRISVADVVFGKLLISKQILPPNLRRQIKLSLADDGSRVAIATGSRLNVKVYVLKLNS